MITTLKIAEEGRNGEVTLAEHGLERTIKKVMGKNDRQFIPYKSISFISHDRKRMGRDVVTLQVGAKTFEWKVALDAEGFVNEVNMRIVGA
jgi:hypothetical protein